MAIYGLPATKFSTKWTTVKKDNKNLGGDTTYKLEMIPVNVLVLWIKTHKNLIYSCSTYIGGDHGLCWKFGGVKKRCEMAEKRCEMVDIEEFSIENPYKPCIFL